MSFCVQEIIHGALLYLIYFTVSDSWAMPVSGRQSGRLGKFKVLMMLLFYLEDLYASIISVFLRYRILGGKAQIGRVAKMTVLQWMSEHTRQDRIRNECNREIVGVTAIEEKIVESRRK